VTEVSLSAILRTAVTEAPGALGGSLAAGDGELVDTYAADRERLSLLAAHYAALLHQTRAALRTFHFGDPVELLVGNRHLSILLRALADGYFALLALEPDAPLASARAALERAAVRLAREVA